MSSTKKYRNFVAEPMRNKPVTDMPGIGSRNGERLAAAGYDKANQVLGQYLVLERNERQFKDWMRDTSATSSKESSQCYKSLNEWSDHFL